MTVMFNVKSPQSCMAATYNDRLIGGCGRAYGPCNSRNREGATLVSA
jgi:hypothetical protein